MPQLDMHLVTVGGQLPEELAQALVALGCRFHRYPVEEWLERNTGTVTPTVLVLHGQPPLWRQLVARLRTHNNPPVLGVFMPDMSETVESITAVCRDFVCWPCERRELAFRLRGIRAANILPKQRQTAIDNEALARLDLIGDSGAFHETVKLLPKMSACEAPILIGGETGTGKEMVARAVHYLSARRDGPFIPVNCGGVPDDLFENELFGHQRGAYTDARDSLPGLVEQAENGTLFLDEIGNLSSKGQCALLRFMQTQEFKRLGCGKLRKANVRIITATNSDLREMVKKNAFREDLLYRLDILSLTLPPLRNRAGDAVVLAEHFLKKLSLQYDKSPKRLSDGSLAWIRQYDWPGNVRELENLIHREFLLAEGDTISIAPPGGHAATVRFKPEMKQVVGLRSLQQEKEELIRNFEQQYLMELLSQTHGNISAAARIAGKERRALGKLIKKHGIDRRKFDQLN